MKIMRVVLCVSSLVTCATNPAYFKPRGGVVITGIGSMINMGLGKITEYFSYSIKHIVRSQGGMESGHRIIKRPGSEYQLNLIPSGIMRKDTTCYLAAGMEIDIKRFLEEIDYLKKNHIATKDRIWISAKAHIVFPYHKTLDECMEAITSSSIDIGSRKGTGAAAAYKRLRIGIRIADLLDEERFKLTLRENLTLTNNMLTKLFHQEPYSYDELYAEYSEYIRHIRPYVKDDLEISLNKKLLSNQSVLLEGAGGSNADINFGAYPYVSSSSTSVMGICTGAGVGIDKIKCIMGVIPAYTTALGNAPLPTEFKHINVLLEKLEIEIEKLPENKKREATKKYKKITESLGLVDFLRDKAEKFIKELVDMCEWIPKDSPLRDTQTVSQYIKDTINILTIENTHKLTKQNFPDHARFGWIDLVMIREALLLNGVDSIVLTKLDALDGFESINVCIDYEVDGKTYDYVPSMITDNKKIKPRYITVKGWKSKTSGIKNFSQLPEEARNFVNTIQHLTNLPIRYISVGPERDQMIVCEALVL